MKSRHYACLNVKEVSKNSLEKCFAEIRGIFLARDLINLPPNILTPLTTKNN